MDRIDDMYTPIKLKQPTRFPIIPLESTLARAKGEATATSSTSECSAVPGRVKKPAVPGKVKPLVVDSYGRTRAARKVCTFVNAAEPTLPLSGFSFREAATAHTKNKKKRKRGNVQRPDQQKR